MLGSRHVDTIVAIAHLASTLSHEGRYEEGEVAQLQVLEARKEILGRKDRSTVASMGDLVITWYKQGRFQEAETLNREVVELSKESFGPHHPFSSFMMHELAKTWHELGRFDEAVALMSEVVDLNINALGKEDADTIKSIDLLACCEEERRGKDKNAEKVDAHGLRGSLANDLPFSPFKRQRERTGNGST